MQKSLTSPSTHLFSISGYFRWWQQHQLSDHALGDVGAAPASTGAQEGSGRDQSSGSSQPGTGAARRHAQAQVPQDGGEGDAAAPPPATLLVPRQTTRGIKVGGYDIPADTKVIVNAWAIGRDTGAWKDPEEFRPERFRGSDVDFNGAHFELLPFGAGHRICPGLAMGVANVEFILASLLYCFDWELPEGVRGEDVSMEEAGALTFHKKIPLMVVPTRFHRSHA
jgi:hypothetical protein